MTPPDRVSYAQHISAFRNQVRKAGFHCAAKEPNRTTAAALQREVLTWDVELGQQLLLQRFLVSRWVLAGDDGASMPVPYWIDPKIHGDMLPSRNGLCLACFDSCQRPVSSVVVEPTGRKVEMAAPPWLGEFVQGMKGGVTDEQLAKSLAPDEIWLRAAFSLDGQLVWHAYRREGLALAVLVGEDQHGSSDDRDRLELAVFQHDAMLATMWTSWQRLCLFIRQLDQSLESGNDTNWAFHWKRLLHALQEPVYSDVAAILHAAFGSDLPRPTPQFARQLRSIWSDVERTWLRRSCNDISEWLLEAVGYVWDMNALAGHLTQETDLMIQVDEVLHAVPIAYLSVAGKRLLERVASVRSVLSPLVDSIQQRDEDDARASFGDRCDRLMAVSHFVADDPASEGAVCLHEMLDKLARQRGCDCLHAFHEPRGALSTLAAGLHNEGQPQSIAVAMTCGHGDAMQAGIRLADVMWSGDYCDLSPIDFLIQVSCSVGRNTQEGWQDVEGFCVELLVHRGRAVLAGKWPLHTREAPVFAVKVAEYYLVARNDRRPNARAWALNQAQRYFLQHPDEVGVNTAAAFDLYGLK
jgi:hypothetical protein